MRRTPSLPRALLQDTATWRTYWNDPRANCWSMQNTKHHYKHAGCRFSAVVTRWSWST